LRERREREIFQNSTFKQERVKEIEKEREQKEKDQYLITGHTNKKE